MFITHLTKHINRQQKSNLFSKKSTMHKPLKMPLTKMLKRRGEDGQGVTQQAIRTSFYSICYKSEIQIRGSVILSKCLHKGSIRHLPLNA